jgi:CHAT domain-containing protein
LNLQLSIPLVDSQLGGSVIYEQYKGDFAQARQISETNLQQARLQKDTEALANALLARGIVHLLQGESPAALECFKEIMQIVPSDSPYLLRALSYTHLAIIWQYNLFPDRGGAAGAEIEARWNSIKYIEALNPQVKQIFSKITDTSLRFEHWLIYDFLAGLQPPRAFLQSAVNSSKGTLSDDLLKAVIRIPEDFKQTAMTYDAPPSLIAYADLAIADFCWRAQNPRLGKEYLTRASETFKQTNDTNGLATYQMIQGDWFAAPYSTPLVWNFAIQEGTTGGSDLTWTVEQNEFNLKTADIRKARLAYIEAEKLFSQTHSQRGLANILLRMSYLAMIEKKYTEAIEYAQKAQKEFDLCGDHLGFWLANIHRILSCVAAGQVLNEDQTIQTIGKWGATEGSFSFTLGLGLLVGRAGRNWLIREGDYERALTCFRLASSLFQALDAPVNVAGSLTDQAQVYLNLGEQMTAVTIFEKAMDTYESVLSSRPSGNPRITHNSVMLAITLYNLYQNEMNAEKMRLSSDRLKSIVEKILSAQANPVGADSFGQTFANMDLIIAKNTLEQAQVLIPLYQAREARDNGDLENAKILFEKAINRAREAGEGERDFLEAVVFAHQKEYPAAIEAYNRYMNRTSLLEQVASKFWLQSGGAQGQAEINRQHENNLENAFSFMVRVKSYTNAKLYLDQLVNLAGDNWPLRNAHPWEALGDEGEMYEGLKDYENALSYYDRAIAAFEARRSQLSRDELKTALAGSKGIQYVYFQASRTASKILQIAEMADNKNRAHVFSQKVFDYSEQGRARSLLDLMAGNAIFASKSKGGSQTLQQWRQLNAQLTTWRSLLYNELSNPNQKPNPAHMEILNKKISTLETEVQEVESKLAFSDPDFHRAISPQAQIIQLDELISLLPKDTAVLQYYFLGEQMLAWAITNQGMTQVQRLNVDVAYINRKIRQYHEACENSIALDNLGNELTEIFLKPLAETIQTNQNLILTPYGAAHVLPFHALPWEDEPLGSKHAISYLPNASSLKYLSQTSLNEHPTRILAIGDPVKMAYESPLDGNTIACNPLPAARLEALLVSKLFSEGRALIGEEATEERVRELCTEYPLLHFATHGYLSEQAPLLSSILLANGDMLTVYELMGLHLNSDLVALSACRTGLGKTTEGEDILGLTRGLLGSGVHAAIVSLWPVNDLSTSLLMREFYKQLLNGKPAVIALQAAQNYLRTLSKDQIDKETNELQSIDTNRDFRTIETPMVANDYSHPHYWAPFILIGSYNSE